jgi:hypothetical protein
VTDHIKAVDLVDISASGSCQTFIMSDDSSIDTDGESFPLFSSSLTKTLVTVPSSTPFGNLGDVFLQNIYKIYRYDDGV